MSWNGASCGRVVAHMRLASIHRWLFLLGISVLATACTASEEAVSSDATYPSTEVEEKDVAVIPETAPAIEVGSVASGSVVIDGTTIDYVTSVPNGFAVGDEAPLLLAFPAGPQDIGLTQSLVEGTYAPEAQRLGWVVISPAAPAGELYFDGSETLIPGLLDWVETWMSPEGGAPHVAGISNGGISTFRFGALNPDRVQSMIAFPGFPRSTDDQEALAQLTNVPVRMFVGSGDTNWIPPAEDAVDALTELGGDVELTIFPGEGHVMSSTRDGTVIFELLESFR